MGHVDHSNNAFQIGLKPPHDWEKHAEKSKSHSIDELVKFLHTQSRVLDAVTEDRIPIGKQKKTMERHLAMNVASKIQKCVKCGEQHHLHACRTFQNMSLDEKYQFITEKRLCRNCLHPGHVSLTCRMRFRCAKCHKKHHVLLHRDQTNIALPEQMANLNVTDTNIATPSINAATSSAQNHVFLSTALVMVRNLSGKWKLARALLDNGAQVNIMSEAICRMLQLTGKGRGQELIGVGKCTVLTAKTVEAEIASRNLSYRRRIIFRFCPR